MLAPAGAGPWPISTVGSDASAVWKMPTRSPPGPLRCGSTTWRTNAAATDASKALPPRSSTAWAVAVASQWVEADMPNVPESVGRVVNGGGGV